MSLAISTRFAIYAPSKSTVAFYLNFPTDHSIGQTRRVQVHKFVCIGTIEDRIDEILTQKAKLADRIVGRGDEWLTSLSTRELRESLALSREAVSEA